MNSIKVFAPASVANVVCGFDVLGFALDSIGDELTIEISDVPGVRLIIEGNNELPTDPNTNTATHGIVSILKNMEHPPGIVVRLQKNLPLGSGMGSSASSAVAGVYGINKLLDLNLNQNQLLYHAAMSESMASGGMHLDNIAPALLGGFTLVRSKDPIDVLKLKMHTKLHSVLIHPHVSVNTKDARQLLRGHIPLEKAVNQTGHIAGFVLGLTSGDTQLMRRSMIDEIVEPVRAALVPGFDEARSRAMSKKIIGCGLSGSGPTIFAIGADKLELESAGNEIESVFADLEIKADVFYSSVGGRGAHEIE